MKTNSLKKRLVALGLAVAAVLGTTLAVCNEPSTVEAKPSSQTILLNGSKVDVTAYIIAGNNYFKLRDLGRLIDFGVGYDAATHSVTIDSDSSYEMADGESATLTNTAHEGAEGKLTTQNVYVDGVQVNVTVYLIDGNNYFKLRDLGELLDFGVDYNAEVKAVDIRPEEKYQPEGTTTEVGDTGNTSDNTTEQTVDTTEATEETGKETGEKAEEETKTSDDSEEQSEIVLSWEDEGVQEFHIWILSIYKDLLSEYGKDNVIAKSNNFFPVIVREYMSLFTGKEFSSEYGSSSKPWFGYAGGVYDQEIYEEFADTLERITGDIPVMSEISGDDRPINMFWADLLRQAGAEMKKKDEENVKIYGAKEPEKELVAEDREVSGNPGYTYNTKYVGTGNEGDLNEKFSLGSALSRNYTYEEMIPSWCYYSVDLINKKRIEQGLPALLIDDNMMEFAQMMIEETVATTENFGESLGPGTHSIDENDFSRYSQAFLTYAQRQGLDAEKDLDASECYISLNYSGKIGNDGTYGAPTGGLDKKQISETADMTRIGIGCAISGDGYFCFMVYLAH